MTARESTNPRYSVLLVEDDEPTRAHLARAIDAHPRLDLIAARGTVTEARDDLVAGKPDVLLTDLGLPDGNGIELIRFAREATPGSQIMVVTVFGDEKNVISSIEAGASGYLLKDGTSEAIGESVMQLMEGGSPMSAPIARRLLERFRSDATTDPLLGAEGDSEVMRARATLTARETEILRLIAKGFTFPEIASLLSISAHTVTSHVRHIYEKLEVNSRGEAVYEAVQRGLIRMDD